jgi:isopenicillin N synthase-like dioxygenase
MARASLGVEKDDLVIPVRLSSSFFRILRSDSIQVIDFSTYSEGPTSAKLEAAQLIVHAFKTSGFVYLRNHGIPSQTISEVFQMSAEFFKRPQEQKDSLSWTTPESNRGYVTFGREKVTRSSDPEEISKLRASNPDLKESMEIGKEGIPGLPNQWPEKIDAEGGSFTKTMRSFFLTCKDLHTEVMRAIALGMGLDEFFFDTYINGGDNNLRLLHYPAVHKTVFKNNPDQVRAGEHSDYGSITLLFQDHIGGLEVRSPKGSFVRAKPIEGTVVVNSGDLLSRWSNDEIRSTRHRVVQPPAEEGDESEMYPARYSIAYFCNPNFDSSIEALPGTWEKSPRGKKYPAVKSGDYLVQRLTATY